MENNMEEEKILDIIDNIIKKGSSYYNLSYTEKERIIDTFIREYSPTEVEEFAVIRDLISHLLTQNDIEIIQRSSVASLTNDEKKNVLNGPFMGLYAYLHAYYGDEYVLKIFEETKNVEWLSKFATEELKQTYLDTMLNNDMQYGTSR